MNNNRIYLSEKIESVREQMMVVASKKGIAHNDSILISQKLDELINEYNEVSNRFRK